MSEPMEEKLREIELEAGKVASAYMLSEHMIADADVKVCARMIAENGCYQFMVTMGVPVAEARYHDVIAEYPATLWDHIKQKLGLKCTLERVTYTEVVSFPDLIGSFNEKLRERARVYQNTNQYWVPSPPRR